MNRLTRILPVAAALICATLTFGCTNDLAGPSNPSLTELNADPPAASDSLQIIETEPPVADFSVMTVDGKSPGDASTYAVVY
ncbi:MAG TPA: hypothetical protein VFS51_05845 [Gemmatimonadales bacterium]|nr:hypothetical protein [Gemmatimonadales bacterium]